MKSKRLVKRAGASIACLFVILSIIGPTVWAATATIGTTDEPSSVKLFEYYGASGTWQAMNTPHHYNTATSEVAYCLEHKASPPHGSSYTSFDPMSTYPAEVYRGVYAILTNGYPSGGTGGLTADQARYATANAIRCWLSEMQSKYSKDFGQYNYTNLANNHMRAKSGNSTATAMWNYMLGLLQAARNGTSLTHDISLTPNYLELTQSGSDMVGTVRVSLTNCNKGYVYDLTNMPSGTQVTGFTGQNGDNLTIRIPAGNISPGNQYQMTFTGKDDRATANYAWYKPSNSDQKIILVGKSLEQGAATAILRLGGSPDEPPGKGGIRLQKRGDGGGSMAGAVFSVTNEFGMQVGTITTGPDGTGSLSDLEEGFYYVTEITAPYGYVLNSNSHIATVRSGDTAYITVDNISVKGIITVTKINSNPPMGDYPRSGAVFEVLNSSGGLVTTITTDASGSGSSSPIPLGSYRVRERTAPYGYVLNTQEFPATLSYAGQTVPIVYDSLSIPDKPQVGTITVKKSDKATGDTPQGDAVLTGAVFEILNAGGDLVETLYCSGTQITSKQLPLGTYKVREKIPPLGYTLDTTVYTINNTYTNQNIEVNVHNLDIRNKVIEGRVAVVKFADEPVVGDPENPQVKDPLEGVVFEVKLKSSGVVYDTIVTNEDGYAITKLIPYGTYIVTETVGKDGYKKVPPFEVFIGTDMKTYSFILENTVHKSEIKIIKTDVTTGKAIPLAGTQFKIKDSAGNWVIQKQLYPIPTTYEVYETAPDGTLVMPQPLRYGSYTLHEQRAPYGYTINEDPIPFSVTGESEVIEVRCENQPVMGTFSINKEGPQLIGATKTKSELGDIYEPVFENRPLNGAVYEIYAYTDIITPDGTVRAQHGELVDTITTGSDGKATSKKLFLGQYYYKEKTAPEGYVLDKETHHFTLVYENQYTAVVTAENEHDNSWQSTRLELSKLAEVFLCKTVSYEMRPGKGFVFGLFTDTDFFGADDHTTPAIPKDTLVFVGETDEKGFLEMNKNLPHGQYYVKELSSPQAFDPNLNRWPVDLRYIGQDHETIKIKVNQGNAIENKLIKKPIRILKSDERDTSRGLHDAVFEVRNERNGLRILLTTDENGEAETPLLPIAEYKVQEIKPPVGFRLTDIVDTVSIAADETAIYVIERNDKPTRVLITKADITNAQKLSDAFVNVFDEKGSLKYSGKTDSNGELYIEEIPQGKWRLVETTAPSGYALYGEDMFFEVDDYGMVTGETEIRNKPIEVVLTKINAATGEKMPGVEIEVFDASGISVHKGKFNENGQITLKYLAVGAYTYKELNTPGGFLKDDRIHTFSVDKYGKATGETVLENTPTRVTITKTDSVTGERIAGAKIAITNWFGSSLFEGETNENGELTVLYLPVGTHYLREVESPKGYVLNKDRSQFTIKEDGTVEGNMEIRNEPTEVVITKTTITGNKPVAGATIEIFDSSGKLVFRDMTNEVGQVKATRLPPGKYTFKESLAPVGYALNPETHSFEIKSDGSIVGTTAIRDEFAQIVIKKTDSKTGATLAGAVFGLYDKNYKLLFTAKTANNGLLIFQELKPGRYNIREVQAPSGYRISSKIISVDVTSTYQNVEAYEVEDSLIVQTGVDDMPVWGYLLIVLGVVGAGVCTVLLVRKKK